MSENLLITNGSTVSENTNSSEPVVNNGKETLPDSSTGNDSESVAGAVPQTTIEECNGDNVEGNDGGKAKDNASQKFSKKDDAIQKGYEVVPKAIDNPEVSGNGTVERVKRKYRRVGKSLERVIRQLPRRSINGNYPKYAPVKRQKRVTENGLNEFKNGVSYEESKDEGGQREPHFANETELLNALPYPSSSAANSKQGDETLTRPEFSVIEGENVKNFLSEPSLAEKAAQTINLSLVKNEQAKKSVLSHFQIMRRVLNRKALYDALLVDGMYQCPICQVRKEKAQYLLLHLKGHPDLTKVFEEFQAFGYPMDEIEKGTPDLPKQSAIVAKAKNPTVEKLILRKNKAKPIINEFGIPILPLPKPKIIRKKTIVKSKPDMQNKPIEIKEDPLPLMASGMPVDEPPDGPLLNPSQSKKMRKRKVPIKRISKRWQAPETYEEPPDDIIVEVKKPRHGVSHSRALDPELLIYVKQVMREKVTEDNPHTCKFCGKTFLKGQGIYAHYFKHSRAKTSPVMKIEVVPKTELPHDLRNGDSAFDDLLPVSDNDDTERNRDTDFLTFQELETNVNRLLRSLVKDTDVLRNLGWPERRVSDLVIDILERCNLQPAYCGPSRLSQLQCLRRNMGKLFRFCIKEEAMQRYGWDIKLVDIVVREMIATEECLKRNRV